MKKTRHISQSELESYLWGAATLLRGYIDAGDYKQFIFPLLFYKRLCDVYDEELANALEESGGDQEYAELPEQHRFQIPAGSHWQAIRTKVKNVGKAIQDALREIERANPETLYGVFGDAQWTNKDRLPDHMLRELVEHFSSQTLSLANCPEDELGVGYEFLIKKFADDSGHTAAEFYTNRTVVHLMSEILEPKPGESIYDPTCGSAGMLLSAVAHLKRQNKEWRTLRLFGQERNLLTSAIGRMNLFLHGVEDFCIVRGDTLANPAFVEGDWLRQFDVVLANPPYSIKQWDRDAWAADPWGRNIYGTPPQGRADYAFWQHIIKSMKPRSGRCAILFPHGVLFRKEESAMREKLVAHDIVECVLGLGPNLFYNSPMEACIVICRTHKPKARRNKVLFIDAVNEVTRERAQSFLTDEHIRHIVRVYQDFSDEKGFARVVNSEEVREKGNNLSIPLYVRGESDNNCFPGVANLKLSLLAWQESARSLQDSTSSLFKVLGDDLSGEATVSPSVIQTTTKKERTIQPTFRKYSPKQMWKVVRFGDVVRNMNLIELDPEGSGIERIVGLEHIDSEDLRIRRWNSRAGETSFTRKFVPGQTLFGKRRAYQRKVAYAEFEGICSGDILVFEPKSKNMLLPEFLPFLCQSDAFFEHALSTSAGSLSPRTSWTALGDFEFLLPPIEEQRRTIKTLWAIDEAAEAYIVAQSNAQNVFESCLDKMAGDRVVGEKHVLGQLFSVIMDFRGKTPKKLGMDWGGEIPAISARNVRVGRVDFEVETKYGSDSLFEKWMSKGPPVKGDILLTTEAPLGNVARIEDDRKYILSQRVILLRANTSITSNDYIEFLMRSRWFQRQLNLNSTGTTAKGIKVSRFNQIKVTVPPKLLQYELVRTAKAVQKSLLDIKKHLVHVASVRKQLVNELVMGGGRV